MCSMLDKGSLYAQETLFERRIFWQLLVWLPVCAEKYWNMPQLSSSESLVMRHSLSTPSCYSTMNALCILKTRINNTGMKDWKAHVMTKAVNCRPLTSQSQVRTQTKWQWEGFFSDYLAFPCECHCPDAIIWQWYYITLIIDSVIKKYTSNNWN
jgi:hypothetical protein